MVALDVRLFSNPNTKVPETAAKCRAEVEKRPTVKAIIDRVKGENGLQAYIDEMNANFKCPV